MISDAQRRALTINVKEMTEDLRDNALALARENRIRVQTFGDDDLGREIEQQRNSFWMGAPVVHDHLPVAMALLGKFDIHFGTLGSIWRDVHVHVRFDDGTWCFLAEQKVGAPAIVRIAFNPSELFGPGLALRPKDQRVYLIDIDVSMFEHATIYQPFNNRVIQSVCCSFPEDHVEYPINTIIERMNVLHREFDEKRAALEAVTEVKERWLLHKMQAAAAAATGNEDKLCDSDDEDDDAHPAGPGWTRHLVDTALPDPPAPKKKAVPKKAAPKKP
jgi:hypothetical protein